MNEWKLLVLAIGMALTSGVGATAVVGEYHIDTESYIVSPERAKRLMTSQPFRGTTIVKSLPDVPQYKLKKEQSKTWFKRQNSPKRIDRPTPYSKRHSTTKGLIPKSEKKIQREEITLLKSAPKKEVDYEDLFRPLPGGDTNLKQIKEDRIDATAHSPRPTGSRVRRAVGRHYYTAYDTMMHARKMKKKLELEREEKWRKYEWRDLRSEGRIDLAEQVQKEIKKLEQLKELPTDVESPMDEEATGDNADKILAPSDAEKTKVETQDESASDDLDTTGNSLPKKSDTMNASTGLNLD